MKNLLKIICYLLIAMAGLSFIKILFETAVIFYKNNTLPVTISLVTIAFTALTAWVYQLQKIQKYRRKTLDSLTCEINSTFNQKITNEKIQHLHNHNYESTKNNLTLILIRETAKQKIKQYEKVLQRKRAQIIYVDDYGREITANWEKELRNFVRQLLLPLDFPHISTETQKAIADQIIKYNNHEENSVIENWIKWLNLHISSLPKSPNELTPEMSGHDYEHYVAGIFQNLGWSASVTKGSGDHGADIIVEDESIRIVVQCKLYSSSVGNKSVQEAYSAMSYYDCNHSCVVSNSNFTPAAKQAASKLDVALLHHDEIAKYLENL